MKKAFLLLLYASQLFSQEIKVSSGSIQKFDDFKSNFVDARTVAVWLPEGYSKKEKYAVLYMHDGQMLFDSTTTWNKQEWKVDEIASKLMAEDKTKKFIVVGVWNNGQKRHSEYFPQKPYNQLTQIQTRKQLMQMLHQPRLLKQLKPF